MFKSFSVLALVFVITGCSEPNPIDININEAATNAELAPGNYKVDKNGTTEINSRFDEKNFGITVDDLSNRLNSASKKAKLGNIPFEKFNIHKGQVNNAFSVEISPDLTMAGSFDRNAKIQSIALIMSQNENGVAETISMLLMARLTVNSLTPNLSNKYTANEMTKVILEAIDKYKNKGHGKASKVVGSVRYSVIADNVTGLWIIFDPV